jgi:hypothetical protein
MNGPGGYWNDSRQSENVPLNQSLEDGAGQYAIDMGSWIENFPYNGNNIPGVDSEAYPERIPSHDYNQQDGPDYTASPNAYPPDFTAYPCLPQADETMFSQDNSSNYGTSHAAHQQDGRYQETESTYGSTVWLQPGHAQDYWQHNQSMPPPSSLSADQSDDAFVDLGEHDRRPQDNFPTPVYGNATYEPMIDNERVEHYNLPPNQYDELRDTAWHLCYMEIDERSNTTNESAFYQQSPMVGDGPWSTLNQHDGHRKDLSPQVNHWVHVANTASDASRTSDSSGNASDSFSSSTDSVEQGASQVWGESSEATVRAGGHTASSQSLHPGQSRHPLEQSGRHQEPPRIQLPSRVPSGTPVHNTTIPSKSHQHPRAE